MSEVDRTRQREHWQAIAEQLGLAPELEESCPPPAPPELTPNKSPQTAAMDTSMPLEELEQPSAEEPPPRRGRRRRSASSNKERAPRQVSSPTLGEDLGTEKTDPEAGRPAEEGSRRGRRRRSSRKSTASDQPSPATEAGTESSREEEPAAAAAERPKRRGRGRGRQKKTAPAKASRPPATQENTAATAPGGSDEPELEDVRTLSNWNVPSWNELIASLYRPER